MVESGLTGTTAGFQMTGSRSRSFVKKRKKKNAVLDSHSLTRIPRGCLLGAHIHQTSLSGMAKPVLSGLDATRGLCHGGTHSSWGAGRSGKESAVRRKEEENRSASLPRKIRGKAHHAVKTSAEDVGTNLLGSSG